MNYRALNCRSSLTVGKKDSGTGRCRLTSDQFKSLSVSIGWIVRVSLCFSNHNHETEILCTAWPDTSSNAPDESTICLDDTVQFSSGKELLGVDWIECSCRVLQVYPPSSCTSVRMTLIRSVMTLTTPTGDIGERGVNSANQNNDSSSSRSRHHHAAAFSGLPVASGVILRAAGSMRPMHAVIRYA